MSGIYANIIFAAALGKTQKNGASAIRLQIDIFKRGNYKCIDLSPKSFNKRNSLFNGAFRLETPTPREIF